MTKEQEKAIKSLDEFSNTKYGGFTTKEGKTVLSLIKEQEEQLKKQDREIEELEKNIDRLIEEQKEREKYVHSLENKLQQKNKIIYEFARSYVELKGYETKEEYINNTITFFTKYTENLERNPHWRKENINE